MLQLLEHVMAENAFFGHKLKQANLQEQQLVEEKEDLKQQLNNQTATLEFLEGKLQEAEEDLALHH
jgi:hypothetical protein